MTAVEKLEEIAKFRKYLDEAEALLAKARNLTQAPRFHEDEHLTADRAVLRDQISADRLSNRSLHRPMPTRVRDARSASAPPACGASSGNRSLTARISKRTSARRLGLAASAMAA